MEYWDLYDKERNKLNKIVKRGDKLQDDEYHIVINAWIRNSKNEFLITQRAANKKYAFMWECTGGSALKGETSLDAAVREVKEEFGIDVKVKEKIYELVNGEVNREEYFFLCEYISGKLGTGDGPEFNNDPKYADRGNFIPEIIKREDLSKINLLPEEIREKFLEDVKNNKL